MYNETRFHEHYRLKSSNLKQEKNPKKVVCQVEKS